MRALLSFALTFTLSACGGSGGGPVATDSPPPSQTPPVADETPSTVPPTIALRDNLITNYTPLSYTPLRLVPPHT